MPPPKIPPIALFGYDSSTFTKKIRLALKLLQVPYHFVIVPTMMPRPMLVDSFNLTYRKIPVLAIGKELMIDTSLIVEWLHVHPALREFRVDKDGGNGLDVHHGPRERVMARLLSSFFTDRPLFRLTTGVIPGAVWRTSFGADRAALIGHKLDPEKLEKKVPRNIAGLDTYLSILEPMFEEIQKQGDGGWILGQGKPSAADVSFYYQLNWGENISRGYGIEDLTEHETKDGFGEGIGVVFNEGRYPALWNWYGKFQRYVEDLPSHETRVERGDQRAFDELIAKIVESPRSEDVPLLPTTNGIVEDLENRSGLSIGTRVSVVPVDTGKGDPTVGELLAFSPEEVVIKPDQVMGNEGKKAKVEDVRLHFPRVGFVVSPVKQSKI